MEISYPSKITRFPTREAEPGWPDHIGTRGYATRLAALESQHSITQSYNTGKAGEDSTPDSTSSSSRPILSLLTSTSTSISVPKPSSLSSPSRRSLTSSLFLPRARRWPARSTEILGQGDSGLKSPSVHEIQIVDGSLELLAEVKILEELEKMEKLGDLGSVNVLIGDVKDDEICASRGKVGKIREKKGKGGWRRLRFLL
jgi:hypothetical protein